MVMARGTRTRSEVLQLVQAGAYLTDGERLLRVERGFADPDAHGLALLEDCRTLETHPVSANEICTLEIDLVRRPSHGPEVRTPPRAPRARRL